MTQDDANEPDRVIRAQPSMAIGIRRLVLPF